jgi:(1->4)-alpha-D-glucan 1-alpha-D-glucosylmutase
MTRLGKSGENITPISQIWAGSRLALPRAEAGKAFRNVFTGEVIEAQEQDGIVGLALDEVLANFPVALLEGI